MTMNEILPGLSKGPSSFGDHDYGSHSPKASDVSMAELESHVNQARDTELKMAELKKQLADATREYDRIVQEVIPSKMAACGLKTITTRSGLKVSIDSKIFAGLPSVTAINKERDHARRRQLIERRDQALQWLEEHGHENLIRHTFKVEFGVDQAIDADAFRQQLAKFRVHGSEGIDVNAQTLSRVVRELHEMGDNYPGEILGVYVKTIAKITT
jgi:hypothetical protein